jgi:hypothetical protein
MTKKGCANAGDGAYNMGLPFHGNRQVVVVRGEHTTNDKPLTIEVE